MDIVRIKPVDTRYRQDSNNLLREAIDQNFETVIIFGFKDGNIHIKASKSRGYLNVLGALEEAKATLIKAASL